jgi:dihydrodipicolinate synthase/N-acetylneuraminate lyase
VATATRHFVDSFDRPVVLYIKHDGYVAVEEVRKMMDDGLINWIKYAIVRDDPAQDDYLRALLEAVDPCRVISGVGEQPAVVHLRDFHLAGFTSGCVCVAPRLSMKMLDALHRGDVGLAEQIRGQFRPLEDLRNSISPIRVLHRAVALAGIADTGPLIPLLCDIEETDRPAIEQAARQLLQREEGVRE